MRTVFYNIAVITVFLLFSFKLIAQVEEASAQVVERILGRSAHRAELLRLKTSISTLLADQRLTDQPARQTLSESLPVLTEMLNDKVGTNAGKLLGLAKWMRTQIETKHSIEDGGGTSTPQQQFVLDNPLAGQEAYLTSLLQWLLTEYVQRDGENAGAVKLEAFLQLYLEFYKLVERSYGMPDDLLFNAPQWMQSRYAQLTADQKRRFLKDVSDARAAKALGPAADEEPAPQPTAAQLAAYNAAYQFIVSNTPQP